MELKDEDVRWLLRDRWAEIHAFEAEESRRETVEARWRRFTALIGLAADLHLELGATVQDEAAVWEGWRRLREAYGS